MKTLTTPMLNRTQTNSLSPLLNKVPQITLAFWLIKIMSTTVGETVADYLAVDAGLGQNLTSTMMGVFLLTALTLQLKSKRYTPWMYWLTVVLVSIVGTQITDLLTDKLHVSLYLSTGIFSVALVALFSLWYGVEKSLSIHQIITKRRELFYWVTIFCTFALGTAAGDLATEALGLGFTWGVAIFGMLIAVCYGAYRFGASAVMTFWAAYILTRPFGAAFGDLLTQSQAYGGLGLGAKWTSIIFLSVIVVLVGLAQFNQRKQHVSVRSISA